MIDEGYIMFYRSEINQNLIVDTDERIGIMTQLDDLTDLKNMEGVDFFDEWEKLKERITALWHKDLNQGLPFFKMESKLIDRFAFFLDFVAQFFLYNGDGQDNQYLKDVDVFFKQHNRHRGGKDSEELFNKAFK